MDETQEQIEESNRRSLWRDVENHLTVAWESLEQAQSALEDLHQPDYADQLQPFVDAIRTASTEAAGESQ